MYKLICIELYGINLKKSKNNTTINMPSVICFYCETHKTENANSNCK